MAVILSFCIGMIVGGCLGVLAAAVCAAAARADERAASNERGAVAEGVDA